MPYIGPNAQLAPDIASGDGLLDLFVFHDMGKLDLLAQATDDAWLVERTGGTVRVVESTPANLKVTTPHDLRIAELLLADRLPRPSAP